jgi:transcription termination factor Rho
LPASGTRKEELLLGPEATRKVALVRREMLQRDPAQGMEQLMRMMRRYKTNAEFLAAFTPERNGAHSGRSRG